MSFNAIRRFVKTISFRGNTRITGIFHRLRVDNYQRRPLGFFLTCSRTSRISHKLIKITCLNLSQRSFLLLGKTEDCLE